MSTTKKTGSYTHVFRNIANDVKKRLKDVPKNITCPVYVYETNEVELLNLDGKERIPKYTFKFDFNVDFNHHNNSQFLVGYDIEYQKLETGSFDLLSHQFYFSEPDSRFGVVILTDYRLTEKMFVDFIAALTPDKNPDFKTAYVAAHFSLIENGWMKPSRQKKEKADGTSYYAPLIPKRNKQWGGKTELKPRYIPPKNSSRGRKKKVDSVPQKPPSVWLHFGDSLNLQYTSLKNLGDQIEIGKQDLNDGTIENMAKLKSEDIKTFVTYGIIDSIITAEAFSYFGNRFGGELDLQFKTRTASYSADHFRNFFKRQYGNNWKKYLGWVRGTPKPEQKTGSWELSPAMRSFYTFYYGGRNEVLEVGPRESATYHDLKSAYPTAVTVLTNDYDFSKPIVTRDSTEIKTRIDTLMNDGAFQVAGVVVSYRFKDTAQPMFPARVDEGLVFPRSGYGHIMWPEFYVALKMDLLDSFQVLSIHEFQKLNSKSLPDEMFRLLNKRKGDNKLIYKNLLNFFYGKTAQGISEIQKKLSRKGDPSKTRPSSVTCYPLAAYMTSFCRAVIGELLQLNQCYGITTDGFISPKPVLDTGQVSDMVSAKLKEIDFDFIEIEKTATKSLFLKTRGYLLINEDVEPDDSGYLKMAAMGIQTSGSNTEKIEGFLKALNEQKYTQQNWTGFSKLQDPPDTFTPNHDDGHVPARIENETTVSTTFDMKRIPVNPKAATFQHSDIEYKGVSFKTEPLHNIDDFNVLRMMSRRNLSLEGYKELIKVAAQVNGIGSRPSSTPAEK